MPDEPTPEPGTPAPTPEPAPSAPLTLPDDHPLVKAYAATKAELAGAKARVKEFEDKDLSETERLTGKATEAEARAAAAEAKAMRLEVAASKGLTPAQAKRLAGSTLEELEADADEILEAFPAKADPDPPPSRKPGPAAPRGGTDPTAKPSASAEVRAAVDAAVSRGF